MDSITWMRRQILLSHNRVKYTRYHPCRQDSHRYLLVQIDHISSQRRPNNIRTEIGQAPTSYRLTPRDCLRLVFPPPAMAVLR